MCICSYLAVFVARYVGEVGDLVVARITSVESKRWRADVHSSRVRFNPYGPI